jgi:hypothetical protein
MFFLNDLFYKILKTKINFFTSMLWIIAVRKFVRLDKQLKLFLSQN